MNLSLSIERKGQFSVRWSGSNRTQCGPEGNRTLYYAVQILGDEEHLTTEGFIIDNRAIHDYFVREYANVRDFLSCEAIACKACRDLKAMFGQGKLRNVKIHGIRVSVGGSPDAKITAAWTAEPPVVSYPAGHIS